MGIWVPGTRNCILYYDVGVSLRSKVQLISREEGKKKVFESLVIPDPA